MKAHRIISVLLAAGSTLLAANGTITGPTVTPSSVSISSPDPDSSTGGGTASVRWGMSGNVKGTWSVAVQAASSSLANCPAIPASAIKVQCTSFTAGSGVQGSCASGSFTLSTSSQTIASGPGEGNGGAGSQSTINLSLSFTDDWKYTASSLCSVQLSYTVTAQ